MRKKRGCGCISAIIGLVIVVVLAIIVFVNFDEVAELAFPRHYEDIIEEIAVEYSIDKWLVMALIRSESNFHANATSEVGARGLMQLMPETAEWLIERGGFTMTREEALAEPEQNIRIGVYYLGILINYYEDDSGHTELATVIAAYNAGIGTVDGWLADDVWDGSDANYTDIPYSETEKHVRNVLRSYDIYQKLYADK